MAAQRYFVAWEKDVSRESWLIWSGPKFSLSLSSFPSVSSPLEKKGYFRTFSHGTTLSTDNVGIGETRGVSQFSIYIYMWGELRAEFYAFCFLWKICTLRNIHVSNSHVSIEFFDVNFYFIRVIQLFVQLFVSDIIYSFIFFILRENLKSIARFEISARIFARLKYIYSPYSWIFI